MPISNAMIVEQGYATIAFPCGASLTTTRLNYDRYVRIDDGHSYPQLCRHASHRGNTLVYSSDEQLAKDCDAKLYKTRKGFDAAAARLRDAKPDWW